MINLLRIPARGLVVSALGQAGLDVHDDLGFGSSFGGGIAQQLQHLLHVLDVLRAKFSRLGIVLKIIVAVGQAETALVEFGDHLAGVLEIGAGPEPEQYLSPLAVQADDFVWQFILRLQGGNAFEVWIERLGSGLLDGAFVHAGGVVVADFLLIGAAPGAIGGGLLQNFAHNVFAPFLKFIEAAPPRTVIRIGVMRLPLAAGIGVEIGAV